MNNQILCDVFITGSLSYLALCLCMIGRPSWVLKFLFSVRRWRRRRVSFLINCKMRGPKICFPN